MPIIEREGEREMLFIPFPPKKRREKKIWVSFDSSSSSLLFLLLAIMVMKQWSFKFLSH